MEGGFQIHGRVCNTSTSRCTVTSVFSSPIKYIAISSATRSTSSIIFSIITILITATRSSLSTS